MPARRGLERTIRAAIFAPYLGIFYSFLVLRRARAALRPGHAWRTWVTPEILLGGFMAPHDVKALKDAGIGAVVNVSRELWAPERALAAAGIAFHRVPCWDMGVPELEDAKAGVDFIADQIASGKRVYVHCASGVGRSVGMVLCYLATHGGLEVDAAYADIAGKRPRVAMRKPQLDFVRRYVSAYGGGGARGDRRA